MFTIDDARRVASEWHGGQGSALYAFASSGYISPSLAVEVDRVVSECSHRVADPAYDRSMGNYTATAAEMLGDAERMATIVHERVARIESHAEHLVGLVPMLDDDAAIEQASLDMFNGHI